jgi:hypothetical protein
VPLDLIAAELLLRDGTGTDKAALLALQTSTSRNDLRMPIEVFAADCGAADSPLRYALISGHR